MNKRKDACFPIIRIQKIELENFKSVSHGEIVFNCGRKVDEQDSKSDILGIYGQNGSGKTSVVEAIAILKKLLSGDSVPARYSECISSGKEYAFLAFTLFLQYSEEKSFSRTVTYSFKIEVVPNNHQEDNNGLRPISSLFPKKVRVFDESLSAAGLFGGKTQKMQDILSTYSGSFPIGPVRKIPFYVGNNKESVIVDLEVNKRSAAKDSKSFIFMDETLNLFVKHGNNSEYVNLLLDIQYYAVLSLYAVDTRTSGMGSVFSFPINTRYGVLGINLLDSTNMEQKLYEELEFFVSGINTVLSALVIDLKLELISNEIIIDGKKGREVRLYSKRKDVHIPLRNESAGIIKLVSVLSLIIASFNDHVTVAIDEFDAGIFEYLLGEILSGLETYGKGQLIFTSHNLRPLEVLKKENLIFTTTNPNKRYIRLKGVGRTNNLRDLYLREILGNDQDEQIYDAAKRQRMIAAFLKAGVGLAEED